MAPSKIPPAGKPTNPTRAIARCALGALLITAGIGHLTYARTSFQAQVPDWVPGNVDTIVLLSGAVEIGLGSALIFIRTKWVGWVVGAFFIAVFPGNISQWVHHRDAFGLDSDTRRFIRLLFQPVLVLWAVWSTAQQPSRRRD
jgi:uncharacterized membrane protein